VGEREEWLRDSALHYLPGYCPFATIALIYGDFVSGYMLFVGQRRPHGRTPSHYPEIDLKPAMSHMPHGLRQRERSDAQESNKNGSASNGSEYTASAGLCAPLTRPR
jgi:hypothetical protein